MWNAFRLTIEDPATVRRVGMLDIVVDIAEKIEAGVRPKDGSYLAMSAHHSVDSSYMRMEGFFYPIRVTLWSVVKEKKSHKAEIAFWTRSEDSECLVMFGHSNQKENNFRGKYEDTFAWIIQKIDAGD